MSVGEDEDREELETAALWLTVWTELSLLSARVDGWMAVLGCRSHFV